MLETLHRCPICDNQTFTPGLKCEDFMISHEHFSIQECTSCKFQFTNPRPDKNSIITYYKSDSYVSHSNKSNNPINLVYKLIRSYTLRQKLRVLKKYTLSGNLLDYGCGTGHFLRFAKKKNWQVTGIEPDQDANKLAQQLIGPENIHTDLHTLQNSSFQAITLFHVLEHIHDLVPTLQSLVDHSAPKGIIIVAVPNHKSYDAQKYKSAWAAYDLPRHLYHFDSQTMKLLAEKVGLKIVAQHPMHFDSYYVSLLSEKYLKNPFYILKGFYSGLISNLKARNNKEYSSLIYVLQKK